MTKKKTKSILFILLLLACTGLYPGMAAAQPGQIFSRTPSYLQELLNFQYQLEAVEKQAEVQAEEEAREMLITVEPGDTLSAIARRHDVSVETLVALNRIMDPNRISVGQELKVALPSEIEYVLKRGDTLAALALAYGVEVESLVEANDVENPRQLPVGMKVIIPNPGQMPPPRQVVGVASRSVVVSTSISSISAPSFIWPVRGTITSTYGQPRGSRIHLGLDIATSSGSPIRAAAAGIVAKARRASGYGNMVVVDHGGGWTTLYAHASRLLVSSGDRVNQGDTIALVGQTGNATGPHVHFEVSKDGTQRNPQIYLK